MPTAGSAARPTITLAADATRGSGVASTQYAIDGGDWVTYTAPFDAPVGEHTLRVRSTDNAGLVETVKELALKVRQVTSGDGGVVGARAGDAGADARRPAASFGAFTPGVARDYTASTTATVVSSAGDATLSVADPSSTDTGHLVNGSFVAAAGAAGRGAARARSAPHRRLREPDRAPHLGRSGEQRAGDDQLQAVDRRQRRAAHRRVQQDAHLHAVDDDTVS